MIPPSVVMIVYAVAAGVSVTALFLAGVLPGLVVALTLIVYNISQRRLIAGDLPLPARHDWREKIRVLNQAKLALLMPLVVLGGIYAGIVTPTESSAVAVVYALIVSVFVYRELPLSRLPGMLLESALLVSAVLVIALLGITGTPFPTYFEGAQFVHFMLGPATVALAGGLGFSAVPQDRLEQGPRATVMQEIGMTADRLGHADTLRSLLVRLPQCDECAGRAVLVPEPALVFCRRPELVA